MQRNKFTKGEDCIKKYERTDNPFDMVRNAFPIYISIDSYSIVIKDVTVEELEELRESGEFDRELMTCRPIMNRDKEGVIKLFTELINISDKMFRNA